MSQDASANHWSEIYRAKDPKAVSWYQQAPQTSLRLVERADPGHGPLVDVGGGAATLVDELYAAGWASLTVVDISAPALQLVANRLPAGSVNLVCADIRDWTPTHDFTVWHDRAALHFLTDPAEQRAYADLARRWIRPGGAAVIATFAPDGPERCSGLPTLRCSPQDLTTLMGPGFALEHAEGEVHTTPWGGTQAFTWVLLRRL